MFVENNLRAGYYFQDMDFVGVKPSSKFYSLGTCSICSGNIVFKLVCRQRSKTRN